MKLIQFIPIALFLFIFNLLLGQSAIEQMNNNAFGENTYFNPESQYALNLNIINEFGTNSLIPNYSVVYDRYNYKERLYGDHHKRTSRFFDKIYYRLAYGYNKEFYNDVKMRNHTFSGVLFTKQRMKTVGIGATLKSFKSEFDLAIVHGVLGRRLNFGAYYKTRKILVSSNIYDVFKRVYNNCVFHGELDVDGDTIDTPCRTLCLKSVNYFEYYFNLEPNIPLNVSLTNRLNYGTGKLVEQVFLNAALFLNRFYFSQGFDLIQASSFSSFGVRIGQQRQHHVKFFSQLNLNTSNRFGFSIITNIGEPKRLIIPDNSY